MAFPSARYIMAPDGVVIFARMSPRSIAIGAFLAIPSKSFGVSPLRDETPMRGAASSAQLEAKILHRGE
jgi:hypothetical protein